MKFGVREICDVVLKARTAQKVGNKVFYEGEPVIYFDTLKTSSMEGAATTVYAQGGRGNARLMAWEGERTVTFTMEDALISPAGFMILSGAGLVDAADTTIYQHATETTIKFKKNPSDGFAIEGTNTLYVGLKAENVADPNSTDSTEKMAKIYIMAVKDEDVISEPYIGHICTSTEKTNAGLEDGYTWVATDTTAVAKDLYKDFEQNLANAVLVDFYIKRTSDAQQIEITPDKFGGYYYLEASTLFRDTNGTDMPAEFIIPKCKIQSNFTFTMASSGDPSTFTFTIDAFPAPTKFDASKEVLAAIQIIGGGELKNEAQRQETYSLDKFDDNGMIKERAGASAVAYSIRGV